MKTEPLHPEFGARVSGIELSSSIDQMQLEQLRELIDRHSLLVFPGQDLDADAHIGFTKLFGMPEEEHVSYYSRGEINYVGTIGNVDDEGNHLRNNNRRVRSQTGNEMWHSDSSFREIPSMLSISHAVEVPPEEGDTEFASGRSGYHRLDSDTRKKIDSLIGIHDYIFSRTKVGEDAVTDEQRTFMYPVRQRLVRCNPRSGEKNLYVGSHVRDIVGWPREDARRLLDDLIAEVTRPESVYRHCWSAGDVVIWDNRCLVHRGCGYDADRYRRLMRQTRVRGICPTIAEPFSGSA